MEMSETEYQVECLHRDYVEALRNARPDDLPEEPPQIAIKHIVPGLGLNYLKNKKLDINLRYDVE